MVSFVERMMKDRVLNEDATSHCEEAAGCRFWYTFAWILRADLAAPKYGPDFRGLTTMVVVSRIRL
jgi:hypothetical protein